MSDAESGVTAQTGGRTRLRRLGKYLGVTVGGLVVLVVILFVLGVVGLPDAGLDDNRWGEVDDRDVEVVTEVWIDNPNPFGFGGSADVEYAVDLEGVRLAEGERTDIEVGSGRQTEKFTTTLFAENLPPWWSSHLKSGEVSQLEADATADVSLGPLSGSPGTTVEDEIETDIEGALDNTTDEFEGEYRLAETGLTAPDGTSIEPAVEIRDVTTEWGEVTEAETEILTTMTIHNDNPYPIPTPAFAGDVEMNGEPVAEWEAGGVRVLDAEGRELAGEEAFIGPDETAERTFLVEMDNENISVWFPTHVDREQPVGNPGVEFTEMVVTAQLAFEISGERLTIPPGDQAITQAFELRTGIFVDQEGVVTPRAPGLRPFDQPDDQLEAAGAVVELEDTGWWEDLLDGENGPLP